MLHLKLFEEYNDNKHLIIVDVQKSFAKFFTKAYVEKLKQYAGTFTNVYQIWDNHSQGPNVDKDYLYDENPHVPKIDDIYKFKEGEIRIEKRYNYQVDADFYKKILDKKVYKEIKNREENNSLKRGDYFSTTEGTIIVYIGNNHQWYHVPKKLYDLFQTLKGQNVTLVGGSDGECLADIEITAKSMGVKVNRNENYIYSASSCPIK